jgi:hypothetical protein
MKGIAIAVIAACALPLAAAAEDFPVPKMLNGMVKGQWRMEMLENSAAKPGQKMPAMTMCADNLLKDTKDRQEKSERRCTARLVKDGSDEAVMETQCPERKFTTVLKRESGKSVLAQVDSTGERPIHVKMRYTHLGACPAGQSSGMSFDKDSEQCQKIRAAESRMDPAKQCANAGANREQCEQTMRQQIARMKAMCN